MAWAFYDFANTIFSMNILTMYFAQWVVVDQGRPDLWYSIAYSASMLLVAVTLPVLGALSDTLAGGRLRFLFAFTAASVIATAGIGAAAQGLEGTVAVAVALIAFAVANYAFQGGLVFYNALLPVVSTPATLGRVSGFGVALGYVGAIVGLLLVSPFVDGRFPFGPDFLAWPEAGGRAAAFIPTALFFALFALPIFLRVREPERTTAPPTGTGPAAGCPLRRAFADVLEGLRDTRRFPGVRRFLVANYLFADAVHTVIIFMAVFAQEVMGMPDSAKIQFFIIATTGAVAGSFVTGALADRHGAKPILIAVLIGWILSLTAVALTSNRIVFWGAGMLVGMLLGGTWTTSRALLSSLVPRESQGRFFGLYALSNKAAAVLGPLLWGLIAWVARDLGPLRYRIAVGSLVLFVLGGLWLLRGVPGSASEARAAESG